MNYYRLNVRFNMDDERERIAAEYLQNLPAKEGFTRSRFAVEAICEYLDHREEGRSLHLEEIRQMLREELRAACISTSLPQNAEEDPKELHDRVNRSNILSDLDALFG